jgi:hypothetical protein
VAEVLRPEPAVLQPGVDVADPAAVQGAKLRAIRGISITVEAARAKFRSSGRVSGVAICSKGEVLRRW